MNYKQNDKILKLVNTFCENVLCVHDKLVYRHICLLQRN